MADNIPLEISDILSFVISDNRPPSPSLRSRPHFQRAGGSGFVGPLSPLRHPPIRPAPVPACDPLRSPSPPGSAAPPHRRSPHP
eukprot:CAMPEP_0172157962 /NCGR_PEP_ID=MMETSP1050-20130122/4103_1 /TAXON_ID=233186 /ORGANISM="Cryptomonas curvata, Strain CCAP979/52" /LENGTH=83 /DNA_ID=CAMNT_0012827291 /DNA_START=503 /DNA_END=751 /DNA_ORIENTATION=-